MKDLLTKYEDWIGGRASKEEVESCDPYTKFLLTLPLFVRSFSPEETVCARKNEVVLKNSADLFEKMGRYDLSQCLSGEVMAAILQELASGNTIIVSEGVIERTDRWKGNVDSGRNGGH